LFEEFAAHRAAARGEEETGWVLLGLREARQAVVLATLPAGAQRDASTTHVLFNCMAQAVASRIVRQTDKRLTILGVVHTHAGSLRHPSEGDFQGDHPWVTQRRGGEGVFGIGTADGTARPDQLFVEQPRPNVQVHQQLTFSWYALGSQDTNYRPLPVSMTLGPDLARPLHTVWSTIETHADQLERLFQQQKGLTCAVSEEEQALVLTLPLAEPGCAIRVVLTEKKVNYYLLRHDQVVAFPCGDDRVDRGVYLLLAEWVAQE
jgi:proteasome lid subunit RPN8/RPN11